MPIPVEHILFPTDFSETAGVAMTYACELADIFKATLHVIHVLENTNPTGGWTAGVKYTPPPPALTEGMEHEGEKELKRILAKLQPQPPKVVLAVQTADGPRVWVRPDRGTWSSAPLPAGTILDAETVEDTTYVTIRGKDGIRLWSKRLLPAAG